MPLESVGPTPKPPPLLEVYEVAHELKCSHETVLRLIRQGKLAAIRPFGRSWRVDPVDLKAFLDARRVNGHEVAPPNGNGHPADKIPAASGQASDNGHEA